MNKLDYINWLKQQFKSARKLKNSIPYYYDYYEQNNRNSCKIALSPPNYELNHHPHIALPYDDNRIVCIDEYINASPMPISGIKYIAMQGPRKNNFNAFWKMIWHERCRLVVSVTNLYEKEGSSVVHKFNAFWPEVNKSIQMNDLNITHTSQEYSSRYSPNHEQQLCLRHLILKKGAIEHKFIHLHLENWPDDGVVPASSLLWLIEEVNELMNHNPIAVHCAAGIGRTGTFIAAHSLYNDILKILETKPSRPTLDIPKRVFEMRKYRFGSMVCWQEQYLLIIETLESALEKFLKIND